MPIAIGGEVFEDEISYTAKLLGIELPKQDTSPTPKEGRTEALHTSGTQVPPAGNNASAGNVGGERGIVDNLLGLTGERYQTWPEKAVRGTVEGAIKAFALPGDVYSGKVQPGSPQEIERAMDLAGLMVFGPAPVASKMADGTLGSFAGVTSKGIDRNRLAQAQLLDAKGVHPDTIWEKTGFFRGADDRWRYEILDKDAKLTDVGFNKRVMEDASGELVPSVSVRPTKQFMTDREKEFDDWAGQKGDFAPVTVGQAFHHPELFKAYPKLKDIRLEPLPKEAVERGVIGQIGDGVMYLADDLHPDFVRSVMLHELQHAIQKQEGFARGGNSLEFRSPALREAAKNFEKVRETSEREIMEAKGWSKADIREYKKIIKNEGNKQEFNIDLWKKKHPEAYEKLKNIVESEKLLKEQSEIELTKYKRLMGEVEARNVQTRMDYDAWLAKSKPPRSTEDTPRFLQEKR